MTLASPGPQGYPVSGGMRDCLQRGKCCCILFHVKIPEYSITHLCETFYGCELLRRRTTEYLILQRRRAIRGINSAANLPDLSRPVAIPAPCPSRTLAARLRESCILLQGRDINNRLSHMPSNSVCLLLQVRVLATLSLKTSLFAMPISLAHAV